MKPDGTGRHPLPLTSAGEAKHPDWSPDGTRLAFVVSDSVWVASVDGIDARMVAECAGDPCLGLDYPAWSPDGGRIAYGRYDGAPVAGGPPSSSAVEIVDVASGKRSVVTQTEQLELVDQPRWSPDGTSLVVQVERFTEDATETGAAIAVIKLAGDAKPKPITDFSMFATYPDWNPKDDRIVFTTHDIDPSGAPVRLFTVNSDGSKLTPIDYQGSAGEHSAQPSWTPDGSQVIFVQMGDRVTAIINPDGSGLQRLESWPATHPRLRPTP